MSRSATREAATWREGRRQRAWELFQMGWRQRQIATALGVSEGAVSQWLAQVRRDGRPRSNHGRGPVARRVSRPPSRRKFPLCSAEGRRRLASAEIGGRARVWPK